ncbi:G-D-S-L family lipolytic protein [Pontibacter sp. JH31]|uniref:G-D-S-L family lipolytic protein n=1 Tax=Pontibacter aquaedesilientis TaxID=2766980 RepID=A0ABR7XDK5_9BACT|nr:SGNH/GDSL hydrolase family protein [Pontibacter aquaedesilientis]MBD1396380.1 G-D-S-L family lipolytic protein [Pontibacter aquaedesilientis]
MNLKAPYRLLYLLLLLAGIACSTTEQPSSAAAQNQQTPDQVQRSKTLPPFWDEIRAFKQQDAAQMPPRQAILFVGSSSIRMWDNLQEMFPDKQVINRGFGGSNLLDLQYYLADIVFPYDPRQIVIYSGENDIASDTVSAQDVLQRFEEVFTSIRQKLPEVPVTFVSIKPSPSRRKYMPVMEEANALIRSYLQAKPNTSYVDVYQPMLIQNGKPRPDIFIADSLHMNQNGYRIWQKAIEPYLTNNKR